jgi:hypothetical protein
MPGRVCGCVGWSEQLADELGVSVRYVRRIIAERRIPYGLTRFERDQGERWVEANRVNVLTGRGQRRLLPADASRSSGRAHR